MYLQHFGLVTRPFEVTPDPRFLYDGALHREALEILSRFSEYHLNHIPREENRRADQLANEAIDQKIKERIIEYLAVRKLKKKMKGIFVITLTPFQENYEIDYEGLRANLQYLLPKIQGKDFLLTACGSVGEFYAMSDEERIKVLEVVADEVGGGLGDMLGGGGGSGGGGKGAGKLGKLGKYGGKLVGGLAKGVGGPQLASEMVEQAQGYGLQLELGEVSGLELYSSSRAVQLKDGRSYTAEAIIAASGCRRRKLGIPGERELDSHPNKE
jgi:hypothetical protein